MLFEVRVKRSGLKLRIFWV